MGNRYGAQRKTDQVQVCQVCCAPGPRARYPVINDCCPRVTACSVLRTLVIIISMESGVRGVQRGRKGLVPLVVTTLSRALINEMPQVQVPRAKLPGEKKLFDIQNFQVGCEKGGFFSRKMARPVDFCEVSRDYCAPLVLGSGGGGGSVESKKKHGTWTR